MGLLTATKQQPAPSSPSVPDLQAQKRAAHDALRAAEQARDDARRAFVRAGSPTAEKLLLEADEAVARARRYFERANELVVEQQRAEAEAKRAELERTRDRLRAELNHTALAELRRPLAEQELAAVLGFVEVRARRFELERDILMKEAELDRTITQLGGEPPHRSLGPSRPPISMILDQLKAYESARPRDDLRRLISETAGASLVRGE